MMRAKWSLFVLVPVSAAWLGAFAAPSRAFAEEKAPARVLIKNVNVFDGKSDKLAMGQDVLVEGNLIKQVGKGMKAGDGATVVDGGGRTLMPGLIDSHVHFNLNAGLTIPELEGKTWEEIGAA